MISIRWDMENMSKLGRLFLRNVIDNMRNFEEAKVRFGETGQGIQPNYQVTFPNGIVRTFRGSSHKPFSQAEEFNLDNLSEAFSLEDIKNIFNSTN